LDARVRDNELGRGRRLGAGKAIFRSASLEVHVSSACFVTHNLVCQ
jgi:hypothetical protein